MGALQDRSSNLLLGTGCGKNVDGPVLDSKMRGKIGVKSSTESVIPQFTK